MRSSRLILVSQLNSKIGMIYFWTLVSYYNSSPLFWCSKSCHICSKIHPGQGSRSSGFTLPSITSHIFNLSKTKYVTLESMCEHVNRINMKVRRDAKNLSSFLKSAPSHCIGSPLFIKSSEIFIFFVPQCNILLLESYTTSHWLDLW